MVATANLITAPFGTSYCFLEFIQNKKTLPWQIMKDLYQDVWDRNKTKSDCDVNVGGRGGTLLHFIGCRIYFVAGVPQIHKDASGNNLMI